MEGDVEMAAAEGRAAAGLDDMKKRLKEMEDESAVLLEIQAKVEQEMGSVQDPAATASQANKEEADSRSVFVGNLSFHVDYACSPAEVQQHFQSCGTVNRVTIRTNKFGQPKGMHMLSFLNQKQLNKLHILTNPNFMVDT